ncbi:MAG: acyl--CoA ligase [Sphingopyxis sp.]|nr:acyl--CoA ligase [Sphingopyxis sp.]
MSAAPSNDPPATGLLYRHVEANAARDAHGEAVVDGDIRLSHAELAAAVEQFAKALIAAGVGKGDRFAILAPPSLDYWISFLGCSAIGAIWVGLNPRYQAAELNYVLQDTDPVILFAATDGAASVQLFAAWPSLNLVVHSDETDLHEPSALAQSASNRSKFIAAAATVPDKVLSERIAGVSPRDPCMIVFTSGSTGQPKGAILHQHGMVSFAETQNAIWPVSEVRVLNYFPINHIGCIIDVSVPALVAGGTMVFMRQFDPALAMQMLSDERITIWGSVPSVLMMQLSLPSFDSYDLSSVELIVWGGAALKLSAIEALRAVCPRLATNYGMTETSSAITTLEPVDDVELLEHSVGHGFPGVEIKLIDGDGREVNGDAVGEVHARSHLNFLGYWNRPEETAAAFDADGFFRTGDLAMRRPDGRYRIVGRNKEMFKSGGYNVYPREVEACIEDFAGVDQCVVVGMSDPVWQEVGCAFVVGDSRVSVADLTLHCRSNLANYKIPKRFCVVETLPLLPIGKVDRLALASLALEMQ